MIYTEQLDTTVWVGFRVAPWEVRGSGPAVPVFMVWAATGATEADVRLGLITQDNRGAFSLVALRRLKELLDTLPGCDPGFYVTAETPAVARLLTWKCLQRGGDTYYVKAIGVTHAIFQS